MREEKSQEDPSYSVGASESVLFTNNTTTTVQSGSSEKEKIFVLDPTPAQLGKAPLQRRLSMGI